MNGAIDGAKKHVQAGFNVDVWLGALCVLGITIGTVLILSNRLKENKARSRLRLDNMPVQPHVSVKPCSSLRSRLNFNEME